jgi:hypothetical protein
MRQSTNARGGARRGEIGKTSARPQAMINIPHWGVFEIAPHYLFRTTEMGVFVRSLKARSGWEIIVLSDAW